MPNPDTTPQQADQDQRLPVDTAARRAEVLRHALDLVAERCNFTPLDEVAARLGIDATYSPPTPPPLLPADPAGQVTNTIRQLQAALENPDTTPEAADHATRLLAAALGCQPDDTPGDPNP